MRKSVIGTVYYDPTAGEVDCRLNTAFNEMDRTIKQDILTDIIRQATDLYNELCSQPEDITK